MRKICLGGALLLLIVSLSACKKEVKAKAEKQEETSIVMKEVEAEPVVQKDSSQKEEKEMKEDKKVDNEQLLKDFGDAYANYNSISDRNAKLKKLMTKECIDKNGIGFDSAVVLKSTGKVTTIYQPLADLKSDNYALWLDCKQNGSPLKVLLLVKVKDGKVAEMTYNTVKQEY